MKVGNIMGRSNSRINTYSEDKHGVIVKKGASSIKEILETSDVDIKLSILFYLDKYLDPWFGYIVPDKKEIISILQHHLFKENNADVREDILDLLMLYTGNELDYLAENIDLLNEEDLPDGIATLGRTYNWKYIDVIRRYINHEDKHVKAEAIEAENDLIEAKKIRDEKK
jgi:hypothetical protein